MTQAAPRHWRRLKLGDILRLRKDVVHPRDRPKGTAIFVGLEHIESGTGRRTGEIEVCLEELGGRKPRFRRGDIVYGYLRPYLNKVWLADFDGLCSVDQYVYEPDRDAVSAGYIAAFMRSPAYLAQVPATPGQLPRIRTEEVAAVRLLLPPLTEQRRLVAELERELGEVERARAAAQACAKAADQLSQAYLRAQFGDRRSTTWPSRSLHELGDIVSGVTLGRPTNGRPTRRVPYVRVANVKDGYLDLSDVYVIDATSHEIEKLRLRRGDLLLTEGGDPDKLGRGTLWSGELPECIHQNHIFRVRVEQTVVLPEFAAAQMNSLHGKRYFLAHGKQTTGIATINRAVLGNFPFLLPSIEEQREVARHLRERLPAVAVLTAEVRARLDTIDALVPALLRRAFSGEL